MGIRILCQSGTESVAGAVASDITSAFPAAPTPAVISGDVPEVSAVAWDDVLIVVYATGNLSEAHRDFVRRYREARRVTGPDGQQRPAGYVLPVAADAQAPAVPPEPIQGLKSLSHPADGVGGPDGRLVRAVGAFLGMTLRAGAQQIFISYRAVDGTEIAEDLYQRLSAAGFAPWRDDAEEGNLPPGSDVQDQIQKHLETAGLILLVDTPQAVASRWIDYEIRSAIGELLPVLPVVAGDRDTRFNELLSLRRRVPIKPAGVDAQGLTDGEWEEVSAEIEAFLLDVYRRRMLVTSRSQETFAALGFSWDSVDEKKRIFCSERPQPFPPVKVLSHCSIFDPHYVAALKTYEEYLRSYSGHAAINHRLCIYDSPSILTRFQKEKLVTENDFSFIPVHLNELTVFVTSDFRILA